LAWLAKSFEAGRHPGQYARERENVRQAVYYYYCRSLAEGLRPLGVSSLAREGAEVDWASLMEKDLASRQQADGAWRNTAVDVREDDPLVATPLALCALKHCRDQLTAAPRRRK
jgi:hypothetical protein